MRRQDGSKPSNIISFDDHVKPVEGSPKWIHETVVNHTGFIVDYLNHSTMIEKLAFAKNMAALASGLAGLALLSVIAPIKKIEAAYYDSIESK